MKETELVKETDETIAQYQLEIEKLNQKIKEGNRNNKTELEKEKDDLRRSMDELHEEDSKKIKTLSKTIEELTFDKSRLQQKINTIENEKSNMQVYRSFF